MYPRLLLLALCAASAFPAGFQSSDLLKLRSVGAVEFSPDGSRIAYTIIRNDGPLRPVAQLWIMTLADRKSISLSAADEPSGDPEWSPDGKWIAYSGHLGDKAGLIVARPDGSGKKYLGPLDGTNAPLPTTGKNIAWSPDSRKIAYVSAQPGPETADATGDPIVITRYLYKPTASEGNSHFNDNKRLHIFIVDVASGASQADDQRHALRALHRLVARRQTDRLHLQSRAERRPVLQLRSVDARRRHRRNAAADRDRERRIPAALVARRQDHRL